ncbi:MAG: hypothetical protein JWL79_353 [Frankiales bacterium]|nr:hypothetical protein [Frankiales bacterium]
MRLGVVVLAGALVVALAGPAAAAAPQRTAYWWQGQTGLGTAPAPASVPPGGLYVASTAVGPTAESALHFTLPAGTQARTLSLKLHQVQQVDALSITAYPTKAVWKAGDNQPWSTHPDHLATPAFPGTLGLDGVTLTFDLSGADLSGNVDLVLASAPPAGAADSGVVTSPTFDATFDKPTTGALTLSAPTVVAPAPSPQPLPPPLQASGPLAPQHLGALAPAAPLGPAVGPGPVAASPSVAPPPVAAPQQLTPSARSTVVGRSSHSTLALALLLALVMFYLGWRTRGALLTASPRTTIYELPPAVAPQPPTADG